MSNEFRTAIPQTEDLEEQLDIIMQIHLDACYNCLLNKPCNPKTGFVLDKDMSMFIVTIGELAGSGSCDLSNEQIHFSSS